MSSWHHPLLWDTSPLPASCVLMSLTQSVPTKLSCLGCFLSTSGVLTLSDVIVYFSNSLIFPCFHVSVPIIESTISRNRQFLFLLKALLAHCSLESHKSDRLLDSVLNQVELIRSLGLIESNASWGYCKGLGRWYMWGVHILARLNKSELPSPTRVAWSSYPHFPALSTVI